MDLVELIRKDQALNMEIEIDATPEEIELIMKGMQIVFDHIKRLSTIETHRLMHGRWIECGNLENALKVKVCCSICGKVQYAIEITNKRIRISENKSKYCPNCGAEMVKGEADEKA